VKERLKAKQRRSFDDWKPIKIEELKKCLHKEVFQDVFFLTKYCEKIGKTWTLDISNQENCFLIMVGAEDSSWIYELDKIGNEYFRQIYLSREDLHFFVRRMNEKRKYRQV
jgi:hypothetical protein